MESYIDKIESMGACDSAVDWLREKNYATLQEAWDNCERGDWMLWLYGRLDRSEARGGATQSEVLAARSATYDAAHDAYDDAYVAAYAAAHDAAAAAARKECAELVRNMLLCPVLA